MRTGLPRRTVLALPGAAMLVACRPASRVVHGVDLRGARYGRDFALPDVDGVVTRLADLRGKVVLLHFGFIQCPDICPTALSRAVDIRRRLGPLGERLQVVFVTIDPQRDTGPVLKAYLAAFDPGFIGLRGDAGQTRAVAEEFKVYYRQVPTGQSYTMDHSTLAYVFDAGGALRLALPHTLSAADCVQDLRPIFPVP